MVGAGVVGQSQLRLGAYGDLEKPYYGWWNLFDTFMARACIQRDRHRVEALRHHDAPKSNLHITVFATSGRDLVVDSMPNDVVDIGDRKEILI